jgi:hypothetical protein
MTLIAQRNITGEIVQPDLRLEHGLQLNLAGLVAHHADHARPFIVSLHRLGEPLAPTDISIKLRDEWDDTVIEAGDVVIVTYLPHGGGGKGGSIIMAIASIALMVIAPYIAAPLVSAMGLTGTAAALATKVIVAGIVMGGTALLSMAFKPKSNKTEETKPVYGVSGGGNLPRPGDRIPRPVWQMLDGA